MREMCDASQQFEAVGDAGSIYRLLCGALSLRGTRDDNKDAAVGFSGAPHHRLISGHHNAVTGLERFMRAGDRRVQGSFNHVGSQFAHRATLAECHGLSGRKLDDLRELV